MAEAGFGRWPAADAPPAPQGFDPWTALRLVGYAIDSPDDTARAFHHHYRGIDRGLPFDAEDLRILQALSASPAQTLAAPNDEPEAH